MMNSSFNQRKKDQRLLLKLARRRTVRSKVSVAQAKKRLDSSREAFDELKFDGL